MLAKAMSWGKDFHLVAARLPFQVARTMPQARQQSSPVGAVG